MSTQDTGSTEVFVDVQRNEIPNPQTWDDLSINQLIDVKLQLMDKLFIAKRMKSYQAPLQQALKRCEALIAEKLASPRA
jgi:hypothetical protein